MRLSIPAIGGSFFLATCLTTLATAADKKPTGAEAETAATRWLDKLGTTGLVLNEIVAEGGFVVTHANGALGRVAGGRGKRVDAVRSAQNTGFTGRGCGRTRFQVVG